MSAERDQRVQTVCLLIISAVAIATGLYWMRPVMIPFIIAVFISLALTPLIVLMIRYLKVPRLIAIFLTLIVCFLGFAFLGGLVSKSIGAFKDKIQNVEQRKKIDQRLSGLFKETVEFLNLDKLGIDPNQTFRLTQSDEPEEDEAAAGQQPLVIKFLNLADMGVDPNQTYSLMPVGESTDSGGDVGKPISILGLLPSGVVRSGLMGITNVIVDILSQGIIIFIFVFFLLIGTNPKHAPRGELWRDIEKRIKTFVVAKTVLSGATGILVGFTLKFCGVEFALIFGVLTFLLNFIPNVGSLVATLLPIPIILISDTGPVAGILAVVIPGVIQFGIGNVAEPKVMGESLDLHPVTILMALIFWGVLWGIIGMLLAMPITAIIRILLARQEITRPIADLLAGRLDRLGNKKASE